MSLSFLTPYLTIQKYQKLEGKLELGDDKEVKERKYSVTIHLWPGRKNTVQMSARFPYPCVGSPSVPVPTYVISLCWHLSRIRQPNIGLNLNKNMFHDIAQ